MSIFPLLLMRLERIVCKPVLACRTVVAAVLAIAAIGCRPSVNTSYHPEQASPVAEHPFYTNRRAMDTAGLDKLLARGNSLLDTQPDSALECYKLLYRSSRDAGYLNGQTAALANMSEYYCRVGNDSQVVQCCLRLIGAAPEAQIKSRHLAAAYYNLGAVAVNRHAAYDKSIFLTLKALSLLVSRNGAVHDSAMVQYIFSNLGAEYASIGEPGKAHLYWDKALEIACLRKDSQYVSQIYADKAVRYMMDSQYTESSRFAGLAVVSGSLCHNDLAVFKGSSTLSTYFLIRGDQAKAAYYRERCNDALQQLKGGGIYQIDQRLAEGDLLVRAGYFAKAEPHYIAALQQARSLHVSDFRIPAAHKTLAGLYARRGAYSLAYAQQQKAMEASEHFLNEQAAHDSRELEIKYRASEKDHLLALSALRLARQQDRMQQHYLWAGILAMLGLFTILYLTLHLRFRKQQEQMATLKAGMEGEEKERARLAKELHDGIVSQLSAIKMQLSVLPIQYKNMDDASGDFGFALMKLDKSIAELRTTAHNLSPAILQEEGLANAIRLFCVQMSAGPVAIEYLQIGALPRLQEDFQLAIYRIVQELVHNMVKYSGAAHAMLQLQVNEQDLSITIDDNGDGLPVAQWAGSGIGLQNIAGRISAIGGSFSIETNSGTSVYLNFDLAPFIVRA